MNSQTPHLSDFKHLLTFHSGHDTPDGHLRGHHQLEHGGLRPSHPHPSARSCSARDERAQLDPADLLPASGVSVIERT